MNPYHRFSIGLRDLVRQARSYPLGGLPPLPKPPKAPTAPRALFFSPHPDDETIGGALTLRLLRESLYDVVNVAVTQGSNKARQMARFEELKAACRYLGFGLVQAAPGGLEKITVKTRGTDPAHWKESVGVIREILAEHKPKMVFFPHDRDWNGTHIGVHYLVTDALKEMPPEFECFTVETEFWGAMDDPNLMVELDAEALGDLIAATTFHVGEVERNPYHLSLPAWMMDNVRRGSELVGGQGGAAPDYLFAALYRARKWTRGGFTRFYEGGKQLPLSTNAGVLFA